MHVYYILNFKNVVTFTYLRSFCPAIFHNAIHLHLLLYRLRHFSNEFCIFRNAIRRIGDIADPLVWMQVELHYLRLPSVNVYQKFMVISYKRVIHTSSIELQ